MSSIFQYFTTNPLPNFIAGVTRQILLAMEKDDSKSLREHLPNLDCNKHFGLPKHNGTLGWGVDTFSITLLFWASLHGKVECVRVLVENGANVNTQMIGGEYNQETALMAAIKGRYLEIVEFLLPQSDLSLRDANGKSALNFVKEGMTASGDGFDQTAIQISAFVLSHLQNEMNNPTHLDTDTKDPEPGDSKIIFREWFESNFRARQWRGVYESFAANGLDDLLFWLHLSNDMVERDEAMFSVEQIFRRVLGLDKQIYVRFFCQQLQSLEMKYFLSCVGLEEHTDTFTHWGFPNLRSVLESEVNDELLRDIGVEKEGHRLRLLYVFERAKQGRLGELSNASSSGYMRRPRFTGEGMENEVPVRAGNQSHRKDSGVTQGVFIG